MKRLHFFVGLFSVLLAMSLTATAQQTGKAKPSPPVRIDGQFEIGIKKITSITIFVKDQDEALLWYTNVLGFKKDQDDSKTMAGFRWLTVVPAGQPDLKIVLVKGSDEQIGKIGQNPPLVVETENCVKTYEHLKSKGVKFFGPPDVASWGVSAVFEDLYGNPFNLVQSKNR